MRSRYIALAILLTGVLAQAANYSIETLLENRAAGTPVTSGLFAGWQTTIAPEFDGYKMLWGKPVVIPGADNPEAFAQAVLAELGSTAGMRFLQRNATPTRDYLIFREYRSDLPVIGGRLDIALNLKGAVSRISQTSFDKWPLSGTHALTQFVAGDYLDNGLEPANWQVDNQKSIACWYPDVTSHALRAAYWLTIAGALPHQRHCGIVDAQTGEVLLEWPGISHEVLNLHVTLPEWPEYEHEEPVTMGCAHQHVIVNGDSLLTTQVGVISTEAGTQADVLATLVGPFVEVTNDDNGEQAVHALHYNAPFGNATFPWTLEQATEPEFNLYYHTVFIHDWYKVIDPQYSALDYPMPAVANYESGYDNAFWNGWGTYYGSGLNYNNFAMYSDVIYHEYTHGATDGIYPDNMLPYTGQPGAMNEAWSDYIGCTINGDALMGEWLTGNAHQALRNLESIMVYPRNWTGEVHSDSPFISAPMWLLRSQLGIGYADSLTHYARYALSELFYDYFVAVLETDDTDGDLSNGTPNDVAIYAAFGRHGIGPGLAPNLKILDLTVSDAAGNNNGYPEAGESLALSFTLLNDVQLYPPDASGVRLAFTTTDPALTIENSELEIGTVGPRESLEFGPLPVLVQAGVEDHWGVLNIEITADQLEEPIYLPIEFTIGVPKLRVVTRSMESDVHEYITSALRGMDVIYRFDQLESGTDFTSVGLPPNSVIMWLSGDAPDCGLNVDDQSFITAHVSGGGKAVLSGKNILEGINGNDFTRLILGTGNAGRTQLRMAASTNLPFEEGATYLLTGSGGAANQDSMTKLTVQTGATSVLRYGPAGANYAGVQGPMDNTLTLGFGIEAIADNTPIGNRPRSEFLARIMDWAGFPTAVDDEQHAPLAPNEFVLDAAYPNPFNSSVRLHYSVGLAAKTELLIYDVLGRQVHRALLSAGSGEYTWQPMESSGLYFAVLKSAAATSTPLKLLLVR